jgi:hypothetical protein
MDRCRILIEKRLLGEPRRCEDGSDVDETSPGGIFGGGLCFICFDTLKCEV